VPISVTENCYVGYVVTSDDKETNFTNVIGDCYIKKSLIPHASIKKSEKFQIKAARTDNLTHKHFINEIYQNTIGNINSNPDIFLFYPENINFDTINQV
jgi:hypothetical protein